VPTFDVTIGFTSPRSIPEIVHVGVVEEEHKTVAAALITPAGDRIVFHVHKVGDATEFEVIDD
jgi:hypothetical protein